MERIDRTNEQFNTNEGYKVIIINYKNANDLLVQFQDEHKAIVHTNYARCKEGGIKNPYHPSVCGLGYIGQGEYKPSIKGKLTKCYMDWNNIFTRIYDEKQLEKHPTYRDCFINKEVYNFQNFGNWYDNNFYKIGNETMCVDKDILVKGNKEYRFDRMIYVPYKINTLFIKSDAIRGDLPIGVTYNKINNKYIAQCRIGSRNKKYLGSYNTPEEAFKVYKEFKEEYIKQVADEYKYYIPKELYEAMYKWEVEITD